MGEIASKDGLNQRQRLFAEAYVNNGQHITHAAISAGYSPKTAKVQGSRLLSHVNVGAYILFLQQKATDITVMTRTEALRVMTRVARASMGNIADWGADGVSFKESDSLDEDSLASVQEISERKGKTSELKVKLYDKVRAASGLLKHYEGMDAIRNGHREDQESGEITAESIQETIDKL